MKKIFITTAIVMLCATVSQSQTPAVKTSVEGQQKTSISKNDQQLTLAQGTQLAGQLQTTLDASKLKEGDAVILKTTEDIKSNGKVIFKKGSHLTGHVTEAQKKSKKNKESKIGLLFDKLENASLLMPLDVTLTAISQAALSPQPGTDDLFATSASATSGARATAPSQGSGGLLGGVTNTVGGVTNTLGGVVNATTQTVGSTVNAATNTVGNTTGTVGQTLKGLQISEAGSAKAQGGSTLSLTGGNLELEKGTVFQLLLNQEAKAVTKSLMKEAKSGKQENQ